MKTALLLILLFISLNAHSQTREDYESPLLAAYIAGTTTVICYGLNDTGTWENDNLRRVGHGTLFIGSCLFVFSTVEYIRFHRKPKARGLLFSPGAEGLKLSYRF